MARKRAASTTRKTPPPKQTRRNTGQGSSAHSQLSSPATGVVEEETAKEELSESYNIVTRLLLTLHHSVIEKRMAGNISKPVKSVIASLGFNTIL